MSEQTDVRVEDWNRLQREVARLRVLVIIALLAVIALAAVSLRRKPDTPTKPEPILRAQGLVITDAQGHDRILIGAPVPASKDRTRKDDASDGIIFLGKNGADRFALGQLPAPVVGGKTGKRIGDGDNYGIVLFDKQGNERGGMAFLGMGRVVLGLDRAAPLSDAIGMMVDDKEGFAGMVLNYADAKAQAPALELGSDANGVHVQFYGKDNLPRAALDIEGSGKPAWKFDDAASAAKAAQNQPH